MPDEEENDTVFTVEKILDKKKEGRRALYLIKWEGFEERDATWEPLSNLNNVKEMVKEFDRQYEMTNSGKEGSTNLSINGQNSSSSEEVQIAESSSNANEAASQIS